MNAGFAQPSGITFSSLHNSAYIADSESSTVRCLSLTDGKVTSVVGGVQDPEVYILFEYFFFNCCCCYCVIIFIVL